MCSGREGLLDTLSTFRTILARVLWWDGDDWHIMHDAIGFDPGEELSPCGIMDALGQFVVLDQVANLQVFVGNQVVRRDERVRRFAGEIFTLPLHFQIGFRQALFGLFAILALFLFARHLPVETLELRLGLAVVALVLYRVPIGIGVEDLQAHIDANHTARLDMFALAFGLDAELRIIAIGAAYNANPLNVLDWEGFNVLIGIAHQAKSPNATAIDEGDMASIGL